MEKYDDTDYPESICGSGKSIYIQRNRDMIDRSRFCIVYYDNLNLPIGRNSGTKIALDYAIQKRKEIILLPPQVTSIENGRQIAPLRETKET